MAAPTMIETSRSHTATGAFGDTATIAGAISGITNANPSVVTFTNPHGLVAGDTVTIAGVTTDTAVNGSWVISSVTSTTITIPVAGNGVAGVGSATCSLAIPISGVTGDWTLRARIESLTANKNVIFAVQDSVDGITWLTKATFSAKGQIGTGAMRDVLEIRSYDNKELRFGTANALVRLLCIAIDSATTCVVTFWYES